MSASAPGTDALCSAPALLGLRSVFAFTCQMITIVDRRPTVRFL